MLCLCCAVCLPCCTVPANPKTCFSCHVAPCRPQALPCCARAFLFLQLQPHASAAAAGVRGLPASGLLDLHAAYREATSGNYMQVWVGGGVGGGLKLLLALPGIWQQWPAGSRGRVICSKLGGLRVGQGKGRTWKLHAGVWGLHAGVCGGVQWEVSRGGYIQVCVLAGGGAVGGEKWQLHAGREVAVGYREVAGTYSREVQVWGESTHPSPPRPFFPPIPPHATPPHATPRHPTPRRAGPFPW